MSLECSTCCDLAPDGREQASTPTPMAMPCNWLGLCLASGWWLPCLWCMLVPQSVSVPQSSFNDLESAIDNTSFIRHFASLCLLQ
eukprot:6175208-Pleurochrysis_carterae.AAC.1